MELHLSPSKTAFNLTSLLDEQNRKAQEREATALTCDHATDVEALDDKVVDGALQPSQGEGGSCLSSLQSLK